MEVQKNIVLDVLDVQAPALSSTNDMPKVELKADAVEVKEVPAAAPKEEKPEAAKTISESATEHTEEVPGEPAEEVKKPPRGVQKRLDELAKREADALRLADSERQEKLRILALYEGAVKTPEKAEKPAVDTDAPTKPLKTEFADNLEGYEAAMDQYIEAKTTFEAQKAVKADRAEQETKAQQQAISDQHKAVRDAYVGRVEKAKEKYTDYLEVAESPDVQVSIPMAHAIMHSEHGPDIAYHLGKNPNEAKRISELSPPLQLVELGLIVAGLKTPSPVLAAPAPKVESPKPPVSNAPKPIKPLGAGSETAPKSAEDESMDEYAARRTKELAAQRRPGMRH